MGISANGAMLPPALASAVIAHPGTFRDRPSGTVHDRPPWHLPRSPEWHGWRSRAVAAGDLRYDTPAAAADGLGSRTTTRPGHAGAGVPVAQSASVWTICGLGEAPCFALCAAGPQTKIAAADQT
jgi:hypothetical protein